MVADLMRRIYGSDDFFPDTRNNAYHAYQSVNYITSHDGFTLYDLVSYDRKNNWANGEQNQDGMNDNYSWNSGYEGIENVPSQVDGFTPPAGQEFLLPAVPVKRNSDVSRRR